MRTNCVNRYLKAFLMGINESMQYRLNFMLSLFGVIFPIVIQVFMWNAIYMQSGTSNVYGFSYHQMLLYTFVSAIVSRFIGSDGFENEVNEDIKNGGLNKYLVKPISYMKYRISCSLGRKIPQCLVIYLVLVTIVFIFRNILHQPIAIERILLFTISICISVILQFALMFGASIAAFWIQDAGSFFVIVTLIINVFSGGVMPLEIFGGVANKIFQFLPFKYAIYYPITILNGKMNSNEIIPTIGIQIFWIVLILIVTNRLWQLGMKKYHAIGG